MSSAAAKVIIDAEDLASKKMAVAAANVERSIKGIKDVGGKAKASTEFIGTLANVMGGSQLGAYSGQLAQLTERISAFSEVSRAGGAGAFAFKAGLAAVVATLSFKVGEMIGNVVFQTAKLTREFERAKEAAADLNAELGRSRDKQFSNQLEDIELIRDPEEKRAAQEALFKQLDNDVQGITAQLKASQKAADEWADAWQITGNRKAYAEEAQRQVEIDKQRLEQAKQQRDLLRDELSERKRINDQIRADNEAAAQAERDAARAKEEAERAAAAAAEQAAQKRIAEAERIADVQKREVERLKEQRIELEQGAEAARAYRLEQEGLDKATAQRLAKEQSEIDQLREKKAEDERLASLGPQQIGSQAVQSRLLTRGPAERGIDKISKNTEKTVDKLDQLIEAFKSKQTPSLQLELVG